MRNPQVNSAVSAVFSVADPQVRTFRTCLPACADSADSELRMCGYTEADNVRISSEYGGYSDRYCASNMSYVICAVFERLLLILYCGPPTSARKLIDAFMYCSPMLSCAYASHLLLLLVALITR